MKRIIEVRNSRTYNLGNYENEKPEISITYELAEWEEKDLNEIVNKLKRYIDAKLDERDPKPRPFEFEAEPPM